MKSEDAVQSFMGFSQSTASTSFEQSLESWKHLTRQQQHSFKLLQKSSGGEATESALTNDGGGVGVVKKGRFTHYQLFLREYLKLSWADPQKSDWSYRERMLDAVKAWNSLGDEEKDDYKRRAAEVKSVRTRYSLSFHGYLYATNLL